MTLKKDLFEKITDDLFSRKAEIVEEIKKVYTPMKNVWVIWNVDNEKVEVYPIGTNECLNLPEDYILLGIIDEEVFREAIIESETPRNIADYLVLWYENFRKEYGDKAKLSDDDVESIMSGLSHERKSEVEAEIYDDIITECLYKEIDRIAEELQNE